MGHRRGEGRQQAALFPVLLDELVGKHALARAELSLAVLAYNLKRVFNMKGAAWIHQGLQG